FDVAGSDVWGPVTYSVDFGDGSPAATARLVRPAFGALARAAATGSIAHTYANAGSYTATVTVNDSAGNSATSTRAVSVSPAPTGGGPAGVVRPLPDPVAANTVNSRP